MTPTLVAFFAFLVFFVFLRAFATLPSMLALKSVVKNYGKRTILSGATLLMQPKDNVCIVGPSGSGKSTMLRLLVRAEDPTTGTVEVDGVNLASVPPPILQLYRRRLGIIFQEPVLLMHATIRENIALPLELLGAPPALIERNTNDLLKRLSLADKADLLPGELSLGERMLTGIARALITSPMIIVADEPFVHLDAGSMVTVSQMLLAMHKKGTTLITLSRNSETADILKARTVELHDGAITQSKKTIKSESPHRILEETEEKVSLILATDETSVVEEPKEPRSGGKKIRITSIGSGN